MKKTSHTATYFLTICLPCAAFGIGKLRNKMFESYDELEQPTVKIDWRKYVKPTLIVCAVVLVLSWLTLPTPYNPGYLFKCAVFTPTAICRDRVYSFSNSRSGTCSNHGGVARWIKK